ncbi:MAG TPA: hypothetical protein VIC34_15185 [Croceibacterium sp.]|jgi:hypothetical protein
MPRKLKVFRTPIGFHDAYVAAPSRKAALEAWGAVADLFARGTAEQVTDPGLMAEPLAHPGEVIRVSRGDLKAQLKALGPRKKTASKPEPKSKGEAKSKPRSRSRPPPKRDRVDRAEAALTEARQRQAGERAGLEEQRAALERELRALASRQEAELGRLERQLAKAQEAYRDALRTWSG